MAKKAPPTPNDPLTKEEITEVKNAHNEIEQRERGTLKFALIAGEILNKAKDNLVGDTWDTSAASEGYLAKTFPKIKSSTDRLYRLLATKKPELLEKAGTANALAEWSIRRARSELAPERDPNDNNQRTDMQKVYDRFIKLTPEKREEVLKKAGINPNPVGGEGVPRSRQAPIDNVVDAIKVEPAPDVVAETVKTNLAPEDIKEVIRKLSDRPEPSLRDLIEEALGIIDKLNTVEALNEVAEYAFKRVDTVEKGAKKPEKEAVG